MILPAELFVFSHGQGKGEFKSGFRIMNKFLFISLLIVEIKNDVIQQKKIVSTYSANLLSNTISQKLQEIEDFTFPYPK